MLFIFGDCYEKTNMIEKNIFLSNNLVNK